MSLVHFAGRARYRVVAFLLILLVIAAGCAGSRPASAPLGEGEPIRGEQTGATESDPTTAAVKERQPSSSRLPVEADMAVRGPALAPITVMAFMDLECPFCARVMPTVEEVESKYEGQVRFVYRHNPLPFHKYAYDAALAAEAVREKGGNSAFFAFVRATHAHKAKGETFSDEMLRETADSVGLTLEGDFRTPERKARVDRDMALAKAIGAAGTPAFRVNGVTLSGSQPLHVFVEVIDAELLAVAKAKQSGVAAEAIYAERVATNFIPSPPVAPEAENPPETTVWKIPVDGSAMHGKADALVTIVEFSEFQCPFCKRVQPTLKRLQDKYGDDVRIVFKHNPLPFHPRAMPAARLALEVRRKKGDAAFFLAVERLFASAPMLEDDDLVAIGKDMGLGEKRARDVLSVTDAYQPTIEADMDLASDLNARGTPHFFINGRRLAGAQPFEKFEELIEEQLAVAKGLVADGTPRSKVYAKLMATATPPPAPPIKEMPPVTADMPVLGNPKAAITWHVFADLECPFCTRLHPTIKEIINGSSDVRVVWHNLPLPFHRNARGAANAALEVRSQLGDAAFWQFVAAVYADEIGGTLPAKVASAAQAVGANRAEVDAAIAEGRFDRLIESDIDRANAGGLSGTPNSIINGYHLVGAQSAHAIDRIIKRARQDARQGKKPGAP